MLRSQRGQMVSQAVVPVNEFQTLKHRADFLHAKGGARWVAPGFVLQARRARKLTPKSQRAISDKTLAAKDQLLESMGPRVGFTVTKRIGNAVMRNRIKRRFREIVRIDAKLLSRAEVDYVVIARQGAEKRRFEDLSRDFKLALRRVHGKLKLKSGDVE